MGMSRCYSLMKCLLILFNIIFLVVGVGVCVFAGWAVWEGRAAEGGGAAHAGLLALGAWAAALTVAAVAALAGAARRSASLLAMSFALLALTLVAEGAAAWWGAAHLPQLQTALKDRLVLSVKHDYGVMPSRTQALDAIQEGLQCCGAEGPRDWQGSAWSRAQAAAALGDVTSGAAGDVTSGAASDVSGGVSAARARTLDLSVGAPTAYYWVPPSCCATTEPVECELARRVPAASGGAPGLHLPPCWPRVLSTLEASSRAPLLAAGALLVAHAAALLLALALCLRAPTDTRYKA